MKKLIAVNFCLFVTLKLFGQGYIGASQGPYLPPYEFNQIKLKDNISQISIQDYPNWFPLFPAGKVTLESLKENKEAILVELGKTESYYKIYQIEGDAKATLLSSMVTTKGKKYIAQSDFVQYGEKEYKSEKKKLGYMIRIQADISNVDGVVDLNGLFALGVAAKLKQVSGSLSVQVLGLAGTTIPNIVGQQFTLTEDSLMRAMENVAILKSRINEKDIVVTPVELPESIETKK